MERTISAPRYEVFDGWMDPRVSGNPWNVADRLLLNPHVNGFFYRNIKGAPHYGPITEMERPSRMRHTWM